MNRSCGASFTPVRLPAVGTLDESLANVFPGSREGVTLDDACFPLPSLRRAAVGSGAVASLLLVAASLASADFETAKQPCTGESVQGRGASFQNNAAKGFITVFTSADGCAGQVATVPQVFYDPAGSGAGRASLGVKAATNPNQDRDPSVRFAGSDEPPTPAERQQMEKGATDANGADVTAADDGVLHVIPVAIGAVTIALHLPDGCTYNAAGQQAARRQPAGDDQRHAREGVRGRDHDLGRRDPGHQLRRREDHARRSAGLVGHDLRAEAVPGGDQSDPRLGGPGQHGVAERRRQHRGHTRRDERQRPAATKLKSTQGGIGYGDLGGIRGAESNEFTWIDAADTTFWIPLQRQTSATYDDPQADANGYKKGATTRGAACTTVTPRNVPTTPADPSLGDWSKVDSTYSGTGYGACTLTYDLAFDDNSTVYCNSAAEERKARTVKDYLTLGVLSVKGQQSATTTDYDCLPGFTGTTNAVPGSLYAIARAAVDSISWKKNGGGPPLHGPPAATPEPTATPTPAPGPQPTVTPPPPAPISNAFTVSSARASGTSIRLSLQLPGAGKISIASSTKPKKGKAINLAAKTVNAHQVRRADDHRGLSSKAKTAAQEGQEAQGLAEDHLHADRRGREDAHQDGDRQAAEEEGQVARP